MYSKLFSKIIDASKQGHCEEAGRCLFFVRYSKILSSKCKRELCKYPTLKLCFLSHLFTETIKTNKTHPLICGSKRDTIPQVFHALSL